MNRERTDWWVPVLTAIRSRYVWIPALVVAVLFVAYWVVPRRAVEIVSVDREHGWRIAAAPPRRKIVWKPAEMVEAPAGDASARDSLIRPQLAEYGSVLYFTLRSPDRGADIYRSRLRDGKWQPAEPVLALNTASDDIGPVFQPGERQLYFYSNRPGGYGGYDLYGSRRNDEGAWSEPTNLGPHINSPAHEYDPAVTADGRRVFFSSNRTPQMGQQMAGDELGQPGDRWDSTLRADLGLPTFDLYAAWRESPQEDWSPAEPLAGINRADTNEGSPYISPAGVFLYFASDRPERSGEPRNFDLYRVRIAGDETGDAQNLGQGVNSPANEIEPALSEEGFRLVFSRDMTDPSAPGADRRYRLYSSVATEVEESIFWDSANLAALAKIVKVLWWWVVLALLLAALVAALIWYLRQVSLRRLPLPAFLLTAVLLHILGGLASFFIYFGEDIVAKLRRDLDVAAVALSSNEMHQSHKPGPESYEKVADLQHVKTIKPAELARKVVERPNVPVAPQVPAPNVPAKLTRDLQQQRPEATLPKSQTDLSGGPELARQRRAVQDMLREKVEVETTQAERAAAQAKPRDLEVAIDRRRPLPEMTAVPRVRRRTVDPQMELAQERIDAERSTDTPLQTPLDQQTVELERAARAAAQPDATETVKTEDVTEPTQTPAAAHEPQRLALEVDRRRPAPQTDAPQLTRRAMSADATMRLARADTSVDRIAEQPVETETDQQPTDLSRTAHAAAEPASQPKVATEQVQAPTDAAAPKTMPQGLAVQMDRQAVEPPVSGAPGLLPRRTPSDTAMRLARADTTVDSVVQAAADAGAMNPTTNAVEAKTIARTSATARDSPAGAGDVQTERLADPAASATGDTAPRRVAVDVARNDAASATGGEATPRLFTPAKTSPVRLGASGVGSDHQVARASFETPTGPTTDAPLTNQRGKAAVEPAAGGKPIQTAELSAPEAGGAGTPSMPQTIGMTVARRASESASAAPGAAELRVALVDRRVGLGGTDAASEKIAEILSAAGPKTGAVTANLARAGQGRAASATGAVMIETVATEGPAVAVAGEGKSSSPRGVGVEVTRRGIVAPAPQGGVMRIAAVSPSVGLSGRSEVSDAATGTATAPAPTSGSISARLSRTRGSRDLAGIAEAQVETDATGGIMPSGTAQTNSTGRAGVDVSIARRGSTGEGTSLNSLQLAMVGTDFGSPRLTGPVGDAVATFDAVTPGSGEVTGKISRANRGSALAAPAAAAVASETVGVDMPAGNGSPGPVSVAGIPVGLKRAEGPMLELPVATSGRIGGLHNPDNHRLVLGSLDSEANNVPPSFSPITSRITRRPARAPRTLFAEDNIGLAAMMKMRQVGEEEKRDLIEAFGGDDDTLEMVRAGLAWIVRQQHDDGHWSLDKFADKQAGGRGKTKSDTAGTALALLPLLGNGNTPDNGPHRDAVRKGVAWLLAHQKDDGDLYTGGDSNGHMYSHGMAAIALCEAYGMTHDAQLREPAQRAIDFIVAAQHKEGGWRYRPGEAGDTSVVGWQVMALKSAQMAELDVPPQTLDKARQFIQRVQYSRGEFKYQRGSQGSPAMTAEGLLCHQYLGASRGDSRLQEGAKYLLDHVPQAGRDTSYCWYYGNQVMYHMQGEYWQKWNEAMKETLSSTQQHKGAVAGSWDPKDKWEEKGGRLYSTSLRVLMLEVYFRHLPLYDMLNE